MQIAAERAGSTTARRGSLAAAMTVEGGKPLIENRDELEWTAAAFDYYAEIGRDEAATAIAPAAA